MFQLPDGAKEEEIMENQRMNIRSQSLPIINKKKKKLKATELEDTIAYEKPSDNKNSEVLLEEKITSNKDEIKEKINKLPNEEEKEVYLNKLNIIIHKSRKTNPESSPVYNELRSFLVDKLNNFNEIVNEVRDECQLPPKTCDWLTKETLTEQELTKYKADLKKKEDEYNKKANKKKAKNAEEEQQEQEENDARLFEPIGILPDLDNLKKCIEIETQVAKNAVLNVNNFTEEYVDRLSRVRTLRHLKNEGGFDNKYAIVRIDIDQYSKIFEDKTLKSHISFDRGLDAITIVKCIKTNNINSLCEIEIKTGRKNQIRCHLSYNNTPILGDKKYGIKDNAKHLMLLANFLEFTHPITKQKITIKLDIPKEYNI